MTNTGYVGLALTKTVTLSNTPPSPGEAITYTIKVVNKGNITATDVEVQDFLPITINGADLDWTGTVTAGDTVSFTINATIAANAGYEATILNTATFSHTSGNGSDTVGFTVISDTTPPDVSGITLIAPIGTIGTTKSPTFNWTDASDSQSGVISYTLLITDSYGTQEISTTVSSYTPATDLAEGVYTWTVKAHDESGNESNYVSPDVNFTILPSNVEKFLPIILLNSTPPLPDLTIIDIQITVDSDVIVTLKNNGSVAVTDAFWIDVYYDQTPALNTAGQVWWGLSSDNGGIPIVAGEEVTLSLSSPYLAGGRPPSAA